MKEFHINNPDLWTLLKARNSQFTFKSTLSAHISPFQNWTPNKTIQEVDCVCIDENEIGEKDSLELKDKISIKGKMGSSIDNQNSFQFLITHSLELLKLEKSNKYKQQSISDGGIILFPNDFNHIDTERKISSSIKKITQRLKDFILSEPKFKEIFNGMLKESEAVEIGSNNDTVVSVVSVGNLCSIKYVNEKETVFDINSLGVMFSDIPTTGLLYYAEGLAVELLLESVMVQDLNENKFLLIS